MTPPWRNSGATRAPNASATRYRPMSWRSYRHFFMSYPFGRQSTFDPPRSWSRSVSYTHLDEPSSSLDPISEYELNHTIANTVGQQAVLFISHRLSTTRMADHIYMLEQGSVVEEGTHEELMAMDGRYAYMFRIQAERYQETAPAG